MSDKKLKRCYFVHDNFDRPFKVCDYNDHTVSIFLNQLGSGIEDEIFDREIQTYTDDNESEMWKFWKSFSYQKIWIPKYVDPDIEDKKWGLGNSILIETTKNKYIYIGAQVLEFSTKTPIIEYQSPIENDDDSTPYAKTKDSYIIFAPKNHYRSKVKLQLKEIDIGNEYKNNTNPYPKYYQTKRKIRNTGSPFEGRNIKSVKILHIQPSNSGTGKSKINSGVRKYVRPKITSRSTKAKRTSRSTKAKKTTRSTKAKKTTRSIKAKRTSRSPKAKKTSRSAKAKKTTRSRK